MKKSSVSGLLALVSTAALLTACPKKNNAEKAALPPEAPAMEVAKAPVEPQPDAAAGSVATAAESSQSPKSAPSAQAAAAAQSKTAVTPASEGGSRVSGTIQVARSGAASFKVAGHVARVNVQVGDRVKKGQLIAQLEDTDYILREKLSQAAVSQAKIALEQARKDLAREDQLKRENVTTQSAFEKVQNASASAQIQFVQAQVSLDQTKKALNDTKLIAPFDGVVSKRYKVEGEYVAVGASVFDIYGAGELEVSLKMPENLLNSVKIGKEVPLSIPSANLDTALRIVRIVPIVQENSRTFEVIGHITRNDERLYPGQFVEAQF